MYVQGVSTRKVAAIMEKLCGVHVSSTQVSQAAAELDAPLGHGASEGRVSGGRALLKQYEKASAELDFDEMT